MTNLFTLLTVLFDRAINLSRRRDQNRAGIWTFL